MELRNAIEFANRKLVWYENISQFGDMGAKVPPFRFMLPFEQDFDLPTEYLYIVSFGWSTMLCVTVGYLVVIFGLQRLMRDHEAFHLRALLFVWNVTLAAISLAGALRMVSEIQYLLLEFGFRHTVCHMGFYEHHKVLGFWTKVFTYSKVWELGDTLFIVLRKRRLIFLHWYHHVTVMLYVYHSTVNLSTTGRWFMSVNMVVHFVMYSYYALKALRIRIPIKVSMMITIGQILQMLVGIYVNCSAYTFLNDGTRCQVNYDAIVASFVMYASYFVLFGAYFVNAYFRNGTMHIGNTGSHHVMKTD